MWCPFTVRRGPAVGVGLSPRMGPARWELCVWLGAMGFLLRSMKSTALTQTLSLKIPPHCLGLSWKLGMCPGGGPPL